MYGFSSQKGLSPLPNFNKQERFSFFHDILLILSLIWARDLLN